MSARYEVRLVRGWERCDTLLEAARLVRAEIQRSDGDWIGSTEWCNACPDTGHVRFFGGQSTVARVSYNGRVWWPDGSEVCPVCFGVHPCGELTHGGHGHGCPEGPECPDPTCATCAPQHLRSPKG